MKILLVEDSCVQQDTIGIDLQKSGHNVDRAFNGDEAIWQASTRSYDLIILDMSPSRESSLLVINELRELNRNIDILILSSREQIRDRVTALIQGADSHLVKPFSPDDLLTRIDTLLNRRSRK